MCLVDDDGEVPDIFCNDERCLQVFHKACLVQVGHLNYFPLAGVLCISVGFEGQAMVHVCAGSHSAVDTHSSRESHEL